MFINTSKTRRLYLRKPTGKFVLNKDSYQAQALVGWWPGNVGGAAGKVYDFAGGGYHGVASSTVNYYNDPIFGRVLNYDNTGASPSQNVTISNFLNEKIGSGYTGDIATFMWIYPTLLNNYMCVYDTSSRHSSLFVGNEYYGIGGGNAGITITGAGGDVSLNEWQLTGLVRRASDNRGLFYRNGLMSGDMGTGVTGSSFTETWNWGDNPSGGGARYTGYRGETRVYKLAPAAKNATPYDSSLAYQMYDPKTRWDLYYEIGKRTVFVAASSTAAFVEDGSGSLSISGIATTDTSIKQGSGLLTMSGIATASQSWAYNGSGSLTVSNEAMRLWKPNNASGLNIWVTSENVSLSGSDVTSANDLSGNGYNFTPTNTAPVQVTNYINGYPAIDHDFGSTRCLATSGTHPYTNFTVFCFAKPGASLAIDGRLIDALYNTGWWIGKATGTDVWKGGVKFSATPYGREVTVTGADSQWSIFGLRRSTSTGYDAFWMNANWTGRNEGATADTLVTSSSKIGLGDVGESPGGGFHLRHKWAEHVIYNVALSDTDREKVEGYIAWKYASASLMPSGHAYRTQPPLFASDVSFTSNNYAYETSGSLTINGMASTSSIYIYLASGKLQFSGTSATTNAYGQEPVGGLTLSAVAELSASVNYLAYGQMSLSGIVSTNFYTSIGSLTVNGTAEVVALYEYLYLASGSVFFSGTASNNYFSATGTLSISGLASVVEVSYNYPARGTLTFNGIADANTNAFDYNITNGTITISGLASYAASVVSDDALGKITLTGAADTLVGFVVEADGALILDGIADLKSQDIEPEGGIILSGSADVLVNFNSVPTGKLRFNGLATASYAYELHGLRVSQFAMEILYIGGSTGEYEGTGSLLFGGEAPHFAYIPPDIKISGLADYIVEYIYDATSGLLSFSGRADAQSHYMYDAAGRLTLSNDPTEIFNPELRFDGMASTYATYVFEGQGLLLRFSGVDQLEADYTFTASGVLVLSGLASLTAQVSDTKEFTWKVLQSQTITKEFTWSVGSRPFSFYRVTGKCRAALCPPIKPNDCASNITFVVNIMARNISEVCRKLKARNFKFPIAKIEQFSNPAVMPRPGEDTVTPTNPNLYSCNQLIDVTPTFSNLECVDLLVDINVTENMVMGMSFIRAFAQTGRGGFKVTGTGSNTAFRIIEPDGALTLSGVADAFMSSFSWIASGGFIVSDTVELTLSAWEYPAFGAIQFNGLATTQLILTDWTSEPVGSLTINGVASDIHTTVRYQPSGALTTGESSGLDFFLLFDEEGTGKKRLSGSADVLLDKYFHVASGSISLKGLFGFVSKAYTITPTGGFRLKGSLPFIATGKLTIGGLATVVYGQQSTNGGRILFGGEALVEIPVAEGTGAMTFGGRADVFCSDLGIVNQGAIGMTDVVVSQNVVFAFIPAPFAQPVTTRVITPCCNDSQPIAFVLEQSLSSLNYFSKFLQRNALSWPSTVVLSYNSRSKIWTDTITLSGFAPEYPGTEKWTITFIWDCFVDSISTPAWRLNVTFSQQSLITGKHRVSKMLFYFDNSQVCKRSKTVDFPFTFNSKIVTTKPSTVRPVVFEDEIGLFKSSKFIAAPTISFKISETHTDSNRQSVNVAPQIGASSGRGTNLVEAISSRDFGSELNVLINPDGTFTTTVTPPSLPPSS